VVITGDISVGSQASLFSYGIIFVSGATARSGPGPPHSRGFYS